MNNEGFKERNSVMDKLQSDSGNSVYMRNRVVEAIVVKCEGNVVGCITFSK